MIHIFLAYATQKSLCSLWERSNSLGKGYLSFNGQNWFLPQCHFINRPREKGVRPYIILWNIEDYKGHTYIFKFVRCCAFTGLKTELGENKQCKYLFLPLTQGSNIYFILLTILYLLTVYKQHCSRSHHSIDVDMANLAPIPIIPPFKQTMSTLLVWSHIISL